MGKTWKDFEVQLIEQMKKDVAYLRRRANEIEAEIEAHEKKRNIKRESEG